MSSSVARPALLFAAVLLASCGSDSGEPEHAVPRLERLELALEREGPRPAEVVVTRLLPSEGLDASMVPAPGVGRVGPVKSMGIERCLFVRGEGDREVVIPGPFETDRFNQVVVTLLVQMRSTTAVLLRREGAAPISSGALPLKSASHPQRIVAGFALNATRTERIESLVIQVPAQSGPVGILAVELVDQPPGSWLEGEKIRGGFVRVDGELRRAEGLVSREALTTRFTPEQHEHFDFGYALAPALRMPGREPQLVLELDDGRSAPTLHRFDLEWGVRGPTQWHHGRVDVGELAGNEVEARFRLIDAKGDACAGWVAEPTLVGPSIAPASVLFITSDTHRGDHLGVAGEGIEVRTPFLDALAERGVLFESAFCTSDLTVPSHVALMTGTHPRDTRVIDNVSTLGEEAPTVAEIFHDAGYRTFAAVSARHLGQRISGLGQGFERLAVPTDEAKGFETVDRVIAWMKDVQDQPVFVWLHLFDAHGPYVAPDEFQREYLAEADTPGLPPHVREGRAKYRGEVSYVDDQLGRVLELNRFRRGVVGFTGDHGEVLGTHGLFFLHEELYTQTLHVPLILAWPGAPAGTRIAVPLDHLGLSRTLLDLAGLDEVAFPGASLLDCLEAEPPEERPKYAIMFGAFSASLSWHGRHLILHLVPHPVGKPEPRFTSELHQVEFYDLESDPGCEHDLVLERMEEAAKYRVMLIRWLMEASDEGWNQEVELDGEMAANLSALGYVTDASRASITFWDPDHECEWCERFEQIR